MPLEKPFPFDLENPQGGEILAWDATEQQFVNVVLPNGGGDIDQQTFDALEQRVADNEAALSAGGQAAPSSVNYAQLLLSSNASIGVPVNVPSIADDMVGVLSNGTNTRFYPQAAGLYEATFTLKGAPAPVGDLSGSYDGTGNRSGNGFYIRVNKNGSLVGYPKTSTNVSYYADQSGNLSFAYFPELTIKATFTIENVDATNGDYIEFFAGQDYFTSAVALVGSASIQRVSTGGASQGSSSNAVFARGRMEQSAAVAFNDTHYLRFDNVSGALTNQGTTLTGSFPPFGSTLSVSENGVYRLKLRVKSFGILNLSGINFSTDSFLALRAYKYDANTTAAGGDILASVLAYPSFVARNDGVNTKSACLINGSDELYFQVDDFNVFLLRFAVLQRLTSSPFQDPLLFYNIEVEKIGEIE